MATTALPIPRRRNSSAKACWIRYPIAPCVSAPSTSSGAGGTARPASSLRSRLSPTCGPFPWVSTTPQPPVTNPATCAAVSRSAACWPSTSRRPFRTREFPPMATTAIAPPPLAGTGRAPAFIGAHVPWTLRALLPGSEILRLLLGQGVDPDAFGAEFEGRHLLVDLGRDRVDIRRQRPAAAGQVLEGQRLIGKAQDRKSTRLNSSHLVISYAVFC